MRGEIEDEGGSEDEGEDQKNGAGVGMAEKDECDWIAKDEGGCWEGVRLRICDCQYIEYEFVRQRTLVRIRIYKG